MRKTIALIVLLSSATFAFSQARFGIRAGVSTMDIETSQIPIISSTSASDFNLAVKEARYGVHAGLFAKFPISDLFFLQPEIVFNSNRVDFQRDDLSEVFTEKYQYLDIPVIAGIKLGPIKPQIGLVGHVFLNSSTEEDFQLEDYKQDFQDLTLGWQGGVGLEIGKIFLDFKYEGNFTNFGEHIRVGGEDYEFDNAPSRLILSFGLAF